MEFEDEETKNIKIILLGESGVGKTCIINRYINNEFSSDSQPTIGSFSSTKKIIKNNIKYSVNVWDTTGQEKYHSITKLYIKGSDIIIFVYSINSRFSFEGLNYWYNAVKEIIQGEKYLTAVIGNKCDLIDNEEISEQEGKKYAEEINAKFKLVSAKEDVGINNLFNSLVDECILQLDTNEKSKQLIITKTKRKKKKKKKCC